MVTTHILATVEPSRLLRATEGLVSGSYSITVTAQSETEVRGFVANGTQYGVALTEERTFCSCPDSMYRKAVCKHAVALALHVIHTPKTEVVEEQRPVNLKLGKVRTGFAFAA